MITLLTGVPGSGKTLFAVELAEKYLKEGRDVFSDIDGYESSLKAPEDWRNCPPGSVVFYDECQKRFPAVGRGRSRDEVITAMEEHRHLGVDLVLISQRPGKIHHDVRGVVGLHHHFLRVYGLERAKIFTRDCLIADTMSSSQLRECDQRFWNFPKNLYGLYKSAEVHTHKAYMPRFVRNALIVLFLIICAFLYIASDAYHFFVRDSINQSDVVSVESLPLTSSELKKIDDAKSNDAKSNDFKSNDLAPLELIPLVQSPVDRDYLKKLSACVSSVYSCRCYDEDYFLIHQTSMQCLKMASSLPVYVSRSSNVVMLDSNKSR